MRTISKAACLAFFLFVVALEVEGRSLKNSASELTSDGVDDDQPRSSFLLLKGIEYSEECNQMYGFMPCSTNIYGHFFLILVYEYLLFRGESFLAAGGKQIFEVLGRGRFGANVFDILGALPESLILLVSGLLSNNESAQEYASTGVGLLAGSSILLLTAVWGTCVFRGHVITTNKETNHMAGAMGVSVLPLIIMQIPNLFQFSYEIRTVTLIISLIVTIIFLFLYFIYQIFEPHIQRIRLDYVEHDHLILKILQRVEKPTLQMILTEDGAPNMSAINKLYKEIDQDGDNAISASQVVKFLLDSELTEKSIDEDKLAEEILRTFDLDNNKMISQDEFASGIKNWLDKTKHALDKQYISTKAMEKIYKVFVPWVQNVRKENNMKIHVISEILQHVQSDTVGNLIREDGTPNESALKRLFNDVDCNNDKKISPSELEEWMNKIDFDNIPVDVKKAVMKIIKELDLDGNQAIDEEEFVTVFKKWLKSSSTHVTLSESITQEKLHQTLEGVEKMMKQKQSKGVVARAIFDVVLGIAILSVLAEPLITSVHKFSEDAGIPSFFISLILVPVAINFREAASAIKEVGHEKSDISQTFYEIYEAVFMNNLLGFLVISILIYVRDISWEFSAEVLVVAIVCTIMSLTATCCSPFPRWTSFGAYLLYALSLVLVYVLNDVLNYV